VTPPVDRVLAGGVHGADETSGLSSTLTMRISTASVDRSTLPGGSVTWK
jgi:hypothetical protein